MATTTIVEEGPARLSLDKVWRDAKRAIRSNPVLFAALSLIAAIPAVILKADTAQARLEAGHFSAGGALWGLLAMFVGLFAQATLTYAAVGGLHGEAPTPRRALNEGAKLLLPVVGLALLMAVGVVCGMILLVVPGVMLLMACYVAIPVLVVERPGIIESLKRSAELTRGSRWRILGLVLLVVLALFVVAMLFNIIGFSLGGQGGVTAPAVLAGVAVQTAYTAFMVALNAAVFVQLRELKSARA